MIDTEDAKTCPKCQMPLEKMGSGSLTQWIKVCNCGRATTAQTVAVPVNICATCGKRIEAGRAGTLTQWIFRADLCSCEAPSLNAGEAYAGLSQSGQQGEPGVRENEPEVALDSRVFPVERYKPLRIIGRGASGTVYLCQDRILKKRVAVKVLNDLSRFQLLAFQREAKATSQLEHDNIVKVLDFGVSEGQSPYMVLEYIEGVSLAELLAGHGPLDLEVALIVFDQICDALVYAHGRDFFHRDLKPSNIIVSGLDTEAPRACLIDFGIGLLKRDEDDSQSRQSVAGSPAYMPADQVQGLPYNARSEVYSIGCVLFETLTGRPPFLGDSSLELISQHAEESPPTLSEAHESILFADSIERLVARCLEKHPEQRFKDVEQVKSAIGAVLAEIPDAAGPVSEPEAPSVQTQGATNRKVFAIVAAVSLLFCTVFGIVIVRNGFFDSEKLHVQAPKDKAPPTLDDAIKTLETNSWYEGADGHGNAAICSSGPVLYDSNFEQLRDFPDLHNVFIALTDNITGVGFKSLRGKKLTDIAIKSTALNDEGLHEIAQFKTLETLRISMASKVSLDGLKELRTLPELRTLELALCELPSGTIPEIVKIKTLNLLSLYNTKTVSVQDVALLPALPNLRFLDLSGTNLAEAVLPEIAKNKGLQQLRLGNFGLTDRYMRVLTQMPQLEYLWISGNPQITDKGFLELTGAKNLRVLVIEGCPGITGGARSKFKKLRPDVKLTMLVDEGTRIIRSLDSD